MSRICDAENFSIGHYIKAMLGVNAGAVSFAMMQVESVGDYFNCTSDKDIDTPEALFRLLVDTNMCDRPVLRVDIATDDGLCANFQGCDNSELDPFEALKNSIGIGADGQPILRIMLSSGLS